MPELSFGNYKGLSRMIKNFTQKFALFSLIFLLFTSCHFGKIQNIDLAEVHSLDNQFFSLDFEKESVVMDDLKRHFFTTFPHDDPTQGEVVYDRKKWVSPKIIRLEKGDGLYLYIKERGDGTAFDSFRLTSKSYFNLNEQASKILFVFKGHVPSGKGLWPAWWLNGSRQDAWLYLDSPGIPSDAELDRYSGKGNFYDTPSAVNPTDWPGAGEIDIIETINADNIFHNTIHTCPQMCDSEWNSDGRIINCANAKPGDPNAGCSGEPYQLTTPDGTFACVWEPRRIRFYYWALQENVRAEGGPLSEKPNPRQWQKNNLKNEVRLLETNLECNSKLHHEWQCENCAESSTCSFQNMKMILNTALCGKWAGSQFDNSENPIANCRSYIFGEGRKMIHDQFLKIEYVAVKKL